MKEIMIYSQSLIFLPIIISILIYTLHKKLINMLVFPVQLIVSLLVVRLWFVLLDEKTVYFTLGGWHKSIGVELSLTGLSWLFMLMAVIIWWVILIYTWHQKNKDYKFLFFLMFLEGCFFAFVQTNDFFTFFVLLEVITILSSILIIYKKDGISLKAGLYYLLFNALGMLIYLFGIMVLYIETGTLNMTMIADYISHTNIALTDLSTIHISFACIFVAMCLKAALFPVYEWLPRAHTAAPAYISALLSGLLVKVGIYGLLRILVIFESFDIAHFVFYLGFFTAFSGMIIAMSQKDMKAILAFSTVSQIGMIIMSMAYQSDVGLAGAYLHIFNHFLFKSLLFLSAGVIINEYGVRRITDIKGLARTHPLLSMMMIVAILSITGAPLFIGFISKTMMKLSSESVYQSWMFQIVSLGTMVYFINFSRIFIGRPIRKQPIHKGVIGSLMLITTLILLAFFVELKGLKQFYTMAGQAMPNVLIKSMSYIEKARYQLESLAEYLLMLMGAYIIVKVGVRTESKFWHFIRHVRVKFQDAVMLLVVFLIVVINYV